MLKQANTQKDNSKKKKEELIFDLVVIGGGITGSGILLDAQSRGLKCCLIEMQDFSEGTSSRSTRLIHGGLRYLKQFNFSLSSSTSFSIDAPMGLGLNFAVNSREGASGMFSLQLPIKGTFNQGLGANDSDTFGFFAHPMVSDRGPERTITTLDLLITSYVSDGKVFGNLQLKN